MFRFLGMSPPEKRKNQKLDDDEIRLESEVTNPESGAAASRFEDCSAPLKMKSSNSPFGDLKPVMIHKEKSSQIKLSKEMETIEEGNQQIRNLSSDKTSAGSSDSI